MKKMTCIQLGGACDLEFKAETFEEMAALSKAHGTEMFAKQDKDHLKAMNEMMTMMSDPSAMKAWMDARKAEFEALPHL